MKLQNHKEASELVATINEYEKKIKIVITRIYTINPSYLTQEERDNITHYKSELYGSGYSSNPVNSIYKINNSEFTNYVPKLLELTILQNMKNEFQIEIEKLTKRLEEL